MKKNTSQQEQEQTKKTKNPYIMYYFWSIVQVIVGIAPLVIFIIVNNDIFFGDKSTCISNTIGLAFACIMICLIFLKKATIFKGLIGFVVFAIVITLLRTVISELYIMSWLAVLGLALTKITEIFVNKWKAQVALKPSIDSQKDNTETIVEAIKSINARG